MNRIEAVLRFLDKMVNSKILKSKGVRCMNRMDAVLQFVDEDVIQIRQKLIKQMLDDFKANPDVWIKEVNQAFNELSSKVEQFQERNTETIYEISVSLLRSSLANNEICFLMEAYSDLDCVEEPVSQYMYKSDYIYSYIECLRNDLRKESRKYVTRIHDGDVEQVIRDEMRHVMVVLSKHLQTNISTLLNDEWHEMFGKQETFKITFGEYFDVKVVLYSEVN